MEFSVSSCIRGYHVYGITWTAVLGEQLLCDREPANVVDRYAVAAKKPGTSAIVGHLLKKISRRCSMFILRGGTVRATVTGRRRYSSDLAQGGLEISCKLTFRGEPKEIHKLRKSVAPQEPCTAVKLIDKM